MDISKPPQIECLGRDELYKLCFKKAPVEGLVMEFGVASGESMNIIAPLTDRMVYGFDSFKGLPEAWYSYQEGHFACNACNIPTFKHSNITLVVGTFQETLPKFIEEHPENAALIYIDCDLYSSTKFVLDTLYHRIVPGTVILFDELYGYNGYEDHELKALQEFMDSGREFEFIGGDGKDRWAIQIKK